MAVVTRANREGTFRSSNCDTGLSFQIIGLLQNECVTGERER